MTTTWTTRAVLSRSASRLDQSARHDESRPYSTELLWGFHTSWQGTRPRKVLPRFPGYCHGCLRHCCGMLWNYGSVGETTTNDDDDMVDLRRAFGIEFATWDMCVCPTHERTDREWVAPIRELWPIVRRRTAEFSIQYSVVGRLAHPGFAYQRMRHEAT